MYTEMQSQIQTYLDLVVSQPFDENKFRGKIYRNIIKQYPNIKQSTIEIRKEGNTIYATINVWDVLKKHYKYELSATEE